MTALRPDTRADHIGGVVSQRLGPGVLLGSRSAWGEEFLQTSRERLLVLLQLLREDPDLEMRLLLDITVVDHGPPPESDNDDNVDPPARFAVLYRLRSPRLGYRATLEVPVEADDATVPTATGLFPLADWYEREVWEMYGIYPDGHPRLRPLLMYEQFAGHPLRRDYPGEKVQPLVPLRIDVRDDVDDAAENDNDNDNDNGKGGDE